MTTRDNLKINRLACLFIVVLTSLILYITIPYFLLINDIIWLKDNDINIRNIGNNSIIFNRSYTINTLYRHVHNFNRYSDIDILVLDGTYHPIRLLDFKVYLNKDLLNYLKYKVDVRDCDDFAFIMYSNIHRLQARYYDSSLLLGILIGVLTKKSINGHVVNFIIDDINNDMLCIEPQTDVITKCYKLFYEIDYIII